MQNMSRDELISLLDTIKGQVARGDSHEGKLHYLLGTDPERPFQVAAIYRVDGTLGASRTEMVGVDIAGPLACRCGDTVGPLDPKTGRCETCIGDAA